jgi:hypothetical protein
MAEPAAIPSAGEVLAWRGFELDPIDGVGVGRVRGCYVDADGGQPTWLAVSWGRRRRARLFAVPVRCCAGGGGRVWAALEWAAMRAAPTIDARRPLLREHEIAICAHYRIGESAGRAAEVAGRESGAITSLPASA